MQGCFLADDEIDRVVEWCRNQAQAHYDEAITRFALEEGEEEGAGPGGSGRDPLFSRRLRPRARDGPREHQLPATALQDWL